MKLHKSRDREDRAAEDAQASPRDQSAPRPARMARQGSIGSQKRSSRWVRSHQVRKR